MDSDAKRPGAADALAWSSDGVEAPRIYARLYEPGSLPDLRFRFMRRLVVGARRWRRTIDQKLRRIDQSQARWETLLCISLRDRLTQGELARLVSVEDPTVARMLTGLAREGMIARAVSDDDRRQRIVELTGEGEKMLAAMQLVVDLLRDHVLQDLNREELEVGLRLLDKILARLGNG